MITYDVRCTVCQRAFLMTENDLPNDNKEHVDALNIIPNIGLCPYCGRTTDIVCERVLVESN
jgi:hypothetical protein